MTDGPTSRGGRTILVVDDEPDLVMLMQIRLTNAGYDVVTAADGQQALDRIAESPPDMTILDVMMPGLTGIEVLQRLRANPTTKEMLVIIMSASYVPTAEETQSRNRADDYIAKPFQRGELQSRVSALFERQSTPGAAGVLAGPAPGHTAECTAS